MGRDSISLRQLMVLLAVALLAPISDLLPGGAARIAGSAGWLAPLCALPLLLAALWLCASLCRGGVGLADAFQLQLGRALGNTVILVYMAWTMLLLAHRLRMCGARLADIYGEGPSFGCSAALLVLAVWMALGKTSALARAGEIFYLALSVLLLGVLALSAVQLEPENLAPVSQELAALPQASCYVGGILLCAMPGGFLAGKLAGGEKTGRRGAGWTISLCAAAALLLGAVIGGIGPVLTERLPMPFATLVQGLGVRGVFQRTEALVLALWTLADLTLIGLLLLAWREQAAALHPGKWARWSVFPAAALALAAGWLLFPRREGATEFAEGPMVWSGLLLGILIPAGISFLKWARGESAGGNS